MRDSYRRCLNKREKQTRSGAAASKMSKCKYFDILAFLNESLSNKETDSNIHFVNDDADGEVATSQLDDGRISDTFRSPPSTPSIESFTNTRRPCQKPGRKKQREDLANNVDLMLVDSLKDVSAICSSLPRSDRDGKNDHYDYNDTDALFCKSLIPNLKSLPGKKNKQAKIKIQQLLYQLEFDEES